MTRLLPALSAMVLLVAPFLAVAADPVIDPAKAKPDEKAGLLWYDIRSVGIEGRGWTDTKAPFDRLPAKAEKLARPPVWGLSRNSTGLCARFVTDATTIHARWTVTNKNLALPHMPATGVSGLDLYAKTDDGWWQWVAIGRPSGMTTNAQLVTGLPTGPREFLLYLPLYNGVSSVEIGLPKASKLMKAGDRPEGQRKPAVFYGTSITQGGCASRPGMVHTAILGRRFNVPVINLGFSGNGTLDAELAPLLGEIDSAVYVLDCLPNLDGKRVSERTKPFVLALRKARPDTPILLVEDRSYTNAALLDGPRKKNADNRAALKKAYEELIAAGVKNLHYLPGDKLLGDDGEGTVDGSHPTDLGFVRQADAFAEVLAPILGTKR